ncbi:DUF3592 domain-containing protein [Sphingobacterium sp. ML3W]|uniref:DUF3592 domain-containing protein n=1 Tax=Sphingobacterium sp. ML3W TaxID=1538644 RepID=UPI00249CC669|nr:DUF3592 domain-containing protein [Sphingobacterium sp. ML3W]WFA79564.1 DUF3592 domain-containing protein [Sphingobacterium sp. ML3W]
MAIAIHLILLLIGLALLVMGILAFLSSRRLNVNGYTVEATVVENIPSHESEGGTMYTALMEYHIGDKIKTFSPNARSNPPAYNIDEKVRLIYDPNNANDVRILSYWGLYLGSIILLAFALPMLLIGSGYFLFKAGII